MSVVLMTMPTVAYLSRNGTRIALNILRFGRTAANTMRQALGSGRLRHGAWYLAESRNPLPTATAPEHRKRMLTGANCGHLTIHTQPCRRNVHPALVQ